ncbi:hypothetical protein CUT44_27785 [Streptomyces carminius]|uniref:Uncharacterized protein n=1 Tax=Streptomyces carminius TaxID=2665496 RepID=A0A2M8LQ82_9ACTN|nr:hypothetical protein [Streptomyces carminius]PJE94107.1 hypothetical protein CUT44_27785 [Streptomyces carminius]
MLDTGYETGNRPSAARRRPVPDGAAGPAAAHCDLVTVPARQGLETVDILRLRRSVGPVLHDRADDTLGFLVPPGTADGWDLPGSGCVRTRHREDRPAGPPVAGADWLVPPESAYAGTTEPARLRAALCEAARTIAAAEGGDRPGS